MTIRFEKKKQPLAPMSEFRRRMLLFLLFGLGFIFFSLHLGAIGYKYFAHLDWVDAYYNASMILTGMGPVALLQTDESKIFATFYSLYSGVAFLTSVGVMFAPLVHRIFHRLHIDID